MPEFVICTPRKWGHKNEALVKTGPPHKTNSKLS